MPHDHPANKSLKEYYPSIEKHMGTNQTLSALRSQISIINRQRTVRNVIETCLKCRKLTANACEQRMALPPFEILAVNERPFPSVHVHYFGPFHGKLDSLRKMIWSLFTCLKIRAVYPEISHSLSTKSLLMAFSRLCSRKDIPMKLFSDNGSNFVGAEVEIRTYINDLSTKKMK